MWRTMTILGGVLGALLGGCSETSLSSGVDRGLGGDTGAADPGGPDASTPADPGDPADAPNDDPCWQPEAGYAQNPAARLIVTDSTLPVTFTWLGSNAGYEQALVLDAPERSVLGEPDVDPPGTKVVAGPWPVGTEVVLADDVWDTGEYWRSGPASRNRDGQVHGAATYRGGCSWWFGFEDAAGGGDADYNDLLVRVDGPLRQVR